MNSSLTQDSADHPAVKLLSDLLAVPAPSGREEFIAAVLREKLDAMEYSHETDPAGNLMVRLEGRNPDAPLCIFAAHMDEISLVVTRVHADGTLRVATRGWVNKMGERPLTIVGDEGMITGVLSLEMSRSQPEGRRGMGEARVLTGLSVEQLREVGIRAGSSAVPVVEGRGPVVFGDPADPLIGAWTLDDRGGVISQLMLLEALKKRDIQPYHPTVVAFTIHEEGGAHGGKVLAQRERPEVFIAVDGCPVPPGSDIKVDARPATWSKDGKAHHDHRLICELARSAREAGTELQMAVHQGVYSDASAVFDSGGAPRVAIIGHVRENRHGYEVARLGVFENIVETLVKFIETWEE